jgi:two-component system, cell cycle response regulator DivK
MAKILVVDDDARNLRLAVTVLEQAGHTVLSADNGIKGIALAQQQRPDLVFMDVQMPDMDGIVALQHLRTNPRTTSLRVIALSALAMKGDAERLLAAGFDGYFEKPIEYKSFLTAIERLLSQLRRSRRL